MGKKVSDTTFGSVIRIAKIRRMSRWIAPPAGFGLIARGIDNVADNIGKNFYLDNASTPPMISMISPVI
jgi:hypothetical protein